MSRGNKIAMYIFTVIFLTGGVIILYFAMLQQLWGLLFVSLFFAGISYIFYRMATKTLLSFDGTSISVCSGFATRSALLAEVAGWRRGEKDTIKLELNSGERSLTIPGNLEQPDEVRNWVKESFTDIEAQLSRDVTEEVIHDERYGLTEADRSRRLRQARKIASYSTLASPVLIFWMFIGPRRIDPLMIVLLAIPLAAVLLTGYYKGILRLYVSKSKPYPSLLFVFIFAIGAALFGVFGYDIYRIDGRAVKLALVLTLLVTIVWAAICRTAAAGEKNLFAVYTGMLLLAGVYSFTALIFSNCAYDRNQPEVLRVAVDGKHTSSGKTTSYFIKLSPWGRFSNGNNVKVSRSYYRVVNIGDSVTVYLHPGKWGIQWYEVM